MYYNPEMYYFELMFPLHLEVSVGNILRSFISENMKHIQKLSVNVDDTIHKIIN